MVTTQVYALQCGHQGVATSSFASSLSSSKQFNGDKAQLRVRSSTTSCSRGRLRIDCVGWGPENSSVNQSEHPGAPGVQNQMVRTKDLAQQMKDMAAAEKRWESQVKEGRVKSLTPKEAGYAVDLSNYTLLDVRPSSERSKSWVKGSIWIPIYDINRSLDPGTILSKLSKFVMGAWWWSGSSLMEYNGRFMPDVVSKIPKSANVIVTCQKGLRSLAACEQFYKAGYRNLFWIKGGLDAAEEGDLTREGPQPFKFAGLGGLSEFLGWTDVQREAARKEGLGFRVMLFGRLMVVVMGADLLLVGGQQLAQYLQGLRQ